jgi:hypothetical protein
MAVKFTNNAATTLAAGINSSVTSIAVTDGSVFPTITGSDHFYVTFDDTTNKEIVKVTARSGNTLTVVRGHDNTTARAFSSGDKAELRIVAALLDDVKTDVSSTLTVDTFTGNGSATAFTLSVAPASEDNLIVFIEGVYQNPGDFALSGTTLTLDVAPANSRKVIVYHVSHLVSGNNLAHNQFTCNGSTTAFTLSLSPIHENNTQVFLDGVYQQKTDYAVSGTTLTMDTAPANGAILEVMTFTQTEVNTLPASFVSGLTQVTAVGADHFMIFDATDSALKKSLVSDVLESATSISTSADATAITIDSSENVTFTGTITAVGTSVFTNLDISGDVDVDGTTNLDVVDIDGAVDMATTLNVGGTATFTGLVDAAIIDGANFKVNGGQGSDGQVLTSTGSGVAWEDAAGGGVTFKTFGIDSIMVGDNATGTISNANYNTGLGIDIFADLTSGDNNVAVGFSALPDLTSGSHNTGIGTYALFKNTTGASNVALGANALFNNTGSSNVAVGYIALETNTTGLYNVAVGQNALGGNTTAASNTGLGYSAGYGNTTGYNNTFVGSSAGGSGVIHATGSDNTFVGAASGGTATDTTNGNAFGSSVKSETNYTTVGLSSSDIRAAHGTATWATVSDRRVKKDIADSTVGLAFINDLRPVTFNYRNKGDIPKEFHGYKEGSTEIYKYSTTNHGFIAQEVKEVIDNHTEIADGFKMWDVRETGQQELAESALIPMLVKALQELSAEVETLKSQLGE